MTFDCSVSASNRVSVTKFRILVAFFMKLRLLNPMITPPKTAIAYQLPRLGLFAVDYFFPSAWVWGAECLESAS
jgi:hypothetical protein